MMREDGAANAPRIPMRINPSASLANTVSSLTAALRDYRLYVWEWETYCHHTYRSPLSNALRYMTK